MTVSSASPEGTQDTLAPSALEMRVLLLLGSLLLVQGETSLHLPPHSPAKKPPSLPSQNNVLLEEVGSHIALFFGRGKTGSFYLHRKDSEELPSGEKKAENISEM